MSVRRFKDQFELVPRADWGAMEPKGAEPLKTPVYMLLLMDTRSKECKTKEECIEVVKAMQKEYMEEKDYDDIPWSFMIGGDGRVYEGRGWKLKPIKTDLNDAKQKLNDGRSLDIAYIGNFQKNNVGNPWGDKGPNFHAFVAAEKLINFLHNRRVIKIEECNMIDYTWDIGKHPPMIQRFAKEHLLCSALIKYRIVKVGKYEVIDLNINDENFWVEDNY